MITTLLAVQLFDPLIDIVRLADFVDGFALFGIEIGVEDVDVSGIDFFFCYGVTDDYIIIIIDLVCVMINK